jgi:hypothetical protein
MLVLLLLLLQLRMLVATLTAAAAVTLRSRGDARCCQSCRGLTRSWSQGSRCAAGEAVEGRLCARARATWLLRMVTG